MTIKQLVLLGIIISLIAIGIMPSTPTSAFQNEPAGFRGVKWGTPINKLPFKVTKIDPTTEMAKGINAEFYVIGELPEDGPVCGLVALDGKLIASAATGLSEDEMIKLLAGLVEQYGQPDEIGEGSEGIRWRGKTTTMILAPAKQLFLMGSCGGLDDLSRRLRKQEWIK